MLYYIVNIYLKSSTGLVFCTEPSRKLTNKWAQK